MAFTHEQQLAIDTHGTNLIVSAGAGSGKTAVLTERIFKMVENGQDVSRLLVLTFTKAAALEMKERIKNRLIKSGKYEEQVDKMDSAYITNFDAYLLSLVKKYHYLLNVDKNVSIVDGGLILLKKKSILDDIFNEYYEKNDVEFLNVLKIFTKKNDDSFKGYILNIAEALEKMVGKEDYLDNYIANHYNEKAISNKVNEYTSLVSDSLFDMLPTLNELYGLTSGSKYGTTVLELINFIESNPNYGTIKSFFNNFSFARISKADDYTKDLKEDFQKQIYTPFVNELIIYQNEEEIQKLIINSQKYVLVIVNILQEYFIRLKAFKMRDSLFEFNDIAMLCLELLNSNDDVRKEIADSFDEILVDEYQDTSDIQETFVNLISKNNVYMVGDIKQSIYRFRNANPYIFKEKYHNYKNNIGGVKIDLTKNFRSRKEVLNNINLLFSRLMSEEYGDANYALEHQMNYGNLDYDTNFETDFNYDMEVLSYDPDESKTYSNNEIEIFIIANQIKQLMNSKMHVYDKEIKGMREIRYSDIAIILDKSTAYDLLCQIFTKEGIPVEVTSNETISSDMISHVISSLFNLVRTVNTNDKMYAYYFMSVARSFLMEMPDNEILSYSLNEFKENRLYDLAYELKKYSMSHSPILTFEKIIKEFKLYEKLVRVGNVSKSLDIINHIAGLVRSLSDIGNTFDDIAQYFNASASQSIEIKVTKKGSGNGVQLLNIHQSKGLEYPICFFAIMNTKFNLSDLKEMFTFDKNYGIITPFFSDRIITSIDKHLLKRNYLLEEISEKIRLFYVAVTRAREKMYFVVPELYDIKECSSPKMFRKLIDLLNYCGDDIKCYTKKVKYNGLVNKDYLLTTKNSKVSFDNAKPIVFNDKVFISEKIEKGKISKELTIIKDEKLNENLLIGTHLHEVLQTIDLKKKDLSTIDIPLKEKDILTKVLNLSCFNCLDNAKIYQELEFMFVDNKETFHGIIDLLVEYPDHFEIIDYKLYHTDKEEYQRQLSVYRKYLSLISNKPIKMYLLSLIKAELVEVKL